MQRNAPSVQSADFRLYPAKRHNSSILQITRQKFTSKNVSPQTNHGLKLQTRSWKKKLLSQIIQMRPFARLIEVSIMSILLKKIALTVEILLPTEIRTRDSRQILNNSLELLLLLEKITSLVEQKKLFRSYKRAEFPQRKPGGDGNGGRRNIIASNYKLRLRPSYMNCFCSFNPLIACFLEEFCEISTQLNLNGLN